MKTMNFLILIALMLFGVACTTNGLVESEELTAIEYRGGFFEEKNPAQTVFELDLHQYSVLQALSILESQKEILEEKIDGGSKELIPDLELVLKDIEYNEVQFINLREVMCNYLGIIAERLAQRASRGDKDAEKELEAMDESLTNCGIEITYREWVNSKIPLPGLGKTKTVGGCQMPGLDFDACKIPFGAGEQVILVDERLDELTILTEKGKPLARAEFIGRSTEIDEFYEYSINVPPSDSELSVRVSKSNTKYTVQISSGQ